jgi:hypothetical protein
MLHCPTPHPLLRPCRTGVAQELQQLVEQQQRELQGSAAARGDAERRAEQRVCGQGQGQAPALLERPGCGGAAPPAAHPSPTRRAAPAPQAAEAEETSRELRAQLAATGAQLRELEAARREEAQVGSA